ncbi:urease accessory protein UreF [Thiohalocapsa sp. ML1]|uniref:urease accessory protein UreF n=1 Tax=Thiohalocapsa sp. ML1 TaxID=1431688 RepID=UPI0009EBBA6E|nr:urease accessory protein UreF [Thiohalocapsa sp. ML1]
MGTTATARSTATTARIMVTETIDTSGADGLALVRLLQLVSPSLPVGGFTYSGGIEWAVEAGWLADAGAAEGWLLDQLDAGVARVDLPIAARLIAAVGADDREALSAWIDLLLACRESLELRAEEQQRGRALADLLVAWELPGAPAWRPLLARSQTAGFAFAAVRWCIPTADALTGLAFGWAENLTLAAVKLVPLGQTDGQRMLARIAARIPTVVDLALALRDDQLGASSPALAIASARHERQYTRLFRS